MADEVILIDGNSVLYRAFFALPLLSNDQGVHTNAVYGFTTMLLKILEEKNPENILVAFDAGKTTFRHETYKEYKGGRQKTPPELSEQFLIVRQLLDAFGIKHYELDQYEADDIIGTISKQALSRKSIRTSLQVIKTYCSWLMIIQPYRFPRKVPLIWKNTHQLQFLRKWVFPEIN